MAKPKKKDFRTRAHSNVLNANDFWFPASPAEVPLAQYFPERAAGARVEFLDVGCGYGSLLLELAALFLEPPDPFAVQLGLVVLAVDLIVGWGRFMHLDLPFRCRLLSFFSVPW